MDRTDIGEVGFGTAVVSEYRCVLARGVVDRWRHEKGRVEDFASLRDEEDRWKRAIHTRQADTELGDASASVPSRQLPRSSRGRIRNEKKELTIENGLPFTLCIMSAYS